MRSGSGECSLTQADDGCVARRARSSGRWRIRSAGYVTSGGGPRRGGGERRPPREVQVRMRLLRPTVCIAARHAGSGRRSREREYSVVALRRRGRARVIGRALANVGGDAGIRDIRCVIYSVRRVRPRGPKVYSKEDSDDSRRVRRMLRVARRGIKRACVTRSF